MKDISSKWNVLLLLRNFFSFTNPLSLLLLLGFAIGLRIPSFHPNYLSTDECFYLVAGEKIAEGGSQYVDTWDNKPPVIAWFYAGFVFIFGDNALLFIRIFTCLYLFICAFLLNQMLGANKFLNSTGQLPGFIFLLLCSVPWYAQELNAELLMLLPLIISAWQIFQVGEEPHRNHSRLLNAGILLGLCVMIKYQALLFFFGFIFAHAIVNPGRFSEFFTLLAGFLLSVFVTVLVLFFSGSLGAWWNIGVLYNLDYIRVGRNPGENIDIAFNIMQYLKLWGVFIFAGLIGLLHFRFNYFTYAIRHRKMEIIFFLWFFAGLLTISIGFGRLYLHYFIALSVPIAVYAAKFLELIRRRWIQFSVSFLALVFPVYTWGVYLAAAYPKNFSFADSYFEPMPWVNWLRETLNNPHPVETKINKSKVKNGILVLDPEPEIYVRLGLPCATSYTNFSIAYYRFGFFDHNKGRSLISGTESNESIYKNFKKQMPEYIIDTKNLFPQLNSQFPLLFKDFKADSIAPYKIYSR